MHVSPWRTLYNPADTSGDVFLHGAAKSYGPEDSAGSKGSPRKLCTCEDRYLQVIRMFLNLTAGPAEECDFNEDSTCDMSVQLQRMRATQRPSRLTSTLSGVLT